MSLEKLVLQTQEKFPRYHHAQVEISPLEKAVRNANSTASARAARARSSWSSTPAKRRKTATTWTSQKFLATAGLNVPAIHYHDTEEGLIWMQDLGEQDLWTWRNASWGRAPPATNPPARGEQNAHHRQPASGGSISSSASSASSYIFGSRTTFFEHCLSAFGLDRGHRATLRRTPDHEGHRHPARHHAAGFGASRLPVAEHPHPRGAAWLIDFQGIRGAFLQYDVASLLYDPYVTLTGAERDSLLEYYKKVARQAGLEITRTSTKFTTTAPSSA